MPRRARGRRPARRPRRRHMRRGHRPHRALIARPGQLKPYSYVFKLAPQILTTAGGASIQVNTRTYATNPFPFTSGSVATYSPNAGITNTVDFGAACTHQLTDLAHVNIFTGMYDAYKITKVTADIEFLNNTSSVAGLAPTPSLWMIWDQDDKVIPTSPGYMTARQGCKFVQPNANKTRFRLTYRPLVAVAAVGTNVEGAMIPNRPVWLDCAFPDVAHYALKLYVSDFATPAGGNENAIRVSFTYHVTFRQPLQLS